MNIDVNNMNNIEMLDLIKQLLEKAQAETPTTEQEPTKDTLEEQEQGQELATPEEQELDLNVFNINKSNMINLKFNNDFISLKNYFLMSSFGLNDKEYRILFLLFYKIQNRFTLYDEKKLTEFICINSDEINLWLKIKKDDYHSIKNILKSFSSRYLELYSYKREQYVKINIISTAIYEKGTIYLIFNPFLKQLLNNDKNFTKIPLMPLFFLKNKYSIRFYIYIFKYNNYEFKTNFINMTIKDFKKLLNIEDKYQENRALRQAVLEVIKNELNLVFEELNFNYELVRTNNSRFYTNIHFSFNTNKLNFKENMTNGLLSAFNKCFNTCSNGKLCNKFFRKNDKACIYCKQYLFKDNIKPF